MKGLEEISILLGIVSHFLSLFWQEYNLFFKKETCHFLFNTRIMTSFLVYLSFIFKSVLLIYNYFLEQSKNPITYNRIKHECKNKFKHKEIDRRKYFFQE